MKRNFVFWAVVVSITLVLSCFPGRAKAEDWGKIDWQQFKGTKLNVLATAMPVSEVYKKRIEKFEALRCNVDHQLGETWPRGMYVLRVKISGGILTQKVIKK